MNKTPYAAIRGEIEQLAYGQTVASYEVARRIIRNGEHIGNACGHYGLNYIFRIDETLYYICYDKSGTPVCRKGEPA